MMDKSQTPKEPHSGSEIKSSGHRRESNAEGATGGSANNQKPRLTSGGAGSQGNGLGSGLPQGLSSLGQGASRTNSPFLGGLSNLNNQGSSNLNN